MDGPTSATATSMWLRRCRISEAPYLTDTHYLTPPPRSELEAALRFSIARREWFRVNELLGQLRAGSVVISGGVLDVAMRDQLGGEGDCAQPPVGGSEGPRSRSPLVPHHNTAPHWGTTSAQGQHNTGGCRHSSSDCSDDERHLVPKSTNVSTYRTPLSAKQEMPAVLFPTPPPTGLMTRGTGGSIVVPASSLPACAPPPVLRFDHDSDWRTNVGGTTFLHSRPDHASSLKAQSAHHPHHLSSSVHQRGPQHLREDDTTTSAASSGTPLSSTAGPSQPRMYMAASSPSGSLSSTPHLSLAGFLADDHPTPHALVKRLLEYPHYDTNYSGPVATAVELGDVRCVRVLLRDARFDPNTGCPVRVAVTANRVECLDVLLSHPRINPNRGGALHQAVVQQKLWAVKALLENVNTQVNRYATGTSSTPLLAAIRACHASSISSSGGPVSAASLTAISSSEVDQPNITFQHPSTSLSNRYNSFLRQASPVDMVCSSLSDGGCTGTLMTSTRREVITEEEIARCLIQSPRVDTNKGFCATPLQLAAASGNVEVVRWLLSKPNTAPNRSIGLSPSPLEIAIEQDDPEVAKLLLSDPRIFVTEETVNRVEAANNIQMMQLISNLSQDMRIGYMWSMRCLVMVAFTTALWATTVCDFVFIAAASHLGVRTYPMMLVGVHVVGSVAATGALLRRRRFCGAVPWHLAVIPFLPLPETAMLSHVVRWLFADSQDVLFRQKLFEMCFLLAFVRGVVVLLPQCIVIAIAFVHGPHALHNYSAATLFFSVLALFVCGVTRMLRIPHSNKTTRGSVATTCTEGGARHRYRHGMMPTSTTVAVGTSAGGCSSRELAV